MDGVLVIDKPEGLTSHDVVAAARRLLGEKRIGHTGTLDPLATGVLPLACGRATRLVRFLTASDKDYEATIRFGVTTDTLRRHRRRRRAASGAAPARDALVDGAGGVDRRVPADAAGLLREEGRRPARVRPGATRRAGRRSTPVPVRVSRLELLEFGDDRCRVSLTCSAGFYVRSFAHDARRALRHRRLPGGAAADAERRVRDSTKPFRSTALELRSGRTRTEAGIGRRDAA